MRSARVFTVICLVLSCGGEAKPGAGGVVSPLPPSRQGSGSGETVASASGSPKKVSQFDCGDFHSCARMEDGTARCWGRDSEGQLGDGDGSDAEQIHPTLVSGLTGVADLASGATFTCARMIDRTVRCWGSGKILGDGREVRKVAPTSVPGLSDAVAITAGGYVVCVRLASGGARCWGLDGIQNGAPDSGVEQVVAGGAHACARMKDGTARCWGEGPWGNGPFSHPQMPPIQSIATGDSFVCATLRDGSTQCWGRNDQGEFGANPDEDNHSVPVVVRGLTDATTLESAESHSCALRKDASVHCWGSNTEGELGRGTRSTAELAAPLSGLTRVLQVSLGSDYGCAKTDDGVLHCWGKNRNGQLGDGTKERRLTPTRVAW